ncbi:MAG: chromosome segregation protein SMC [Deltaproteobacteria bacterium]|nr:MAG: chromosome segregation protein SMC [Deltaproteobacteria bacterium]
MKLKKLELIGFKSFYDKTTFDFSDGITAIVGPNGCGKSNIVDAIRWVLGEHAPSHLRSKALEDVIFAGSDAAGPLGMAEVTLTFVNDDGIAPPGYESYSEISVTRRTFRDGESEFSINRIPCRLKDIAELFLDTGAGARGYAIVRQGKVGEIVSARPEEKRQIIEEAAGVAKFRVRRKEAERKMESTRQNLARVKDILEEVRRQIATLERQVRKAERYKALRAELRELDLRIATRRRRAMSGECDDAGKELLSLEDVLIASRTEISRLDAEREQALAAREEREKVLAGMREEHAAGKQEAARREAEWEGLRARAEQYRRMIAEADGELAVLDAEIADHDLRLGVFAEESSLRKDELSRTRRRWEEEKEALARAREAHTRGQDQAGRATSDLMVRVTQHSTAQSGAEALSRRIEEVERTLARLAERIDEAAAAVGKASSDHAAAVSADEGARSALSTAEISWEETGALLAATNMRLDAAVDAARRAEGDLQSAESRLSTLSRIYEQRDWTSSGVRAVLHHFGNGGTMESGGEGIYGVMGDLIETDVAYEKAVEAVLGERMQSVVVRDHADGLSAIHYLKESREGRGAFVPVALRTRGEKLAYVGEEDVVGPLTEVVQAPPECNDLVRGLLGGTLLVRNLDAAIRLWNRNGVWNSYVTLDGDVVTADGILIGGEQGSSAEAGVLARKREIRELEREIGVLRAERDRMLTEEGTVRRMRAEIEERLSGMFHAREEAGAANAAAARDRAVLSETLAQARALLDGRTQEDAFLRGELSRMRDELSASIEAARETGQARGEEEERSRALLAELEAMRIRMEECRERAHAAEVAHSGLEEKDSAATALHAQLAEQVDGKRRLSDDRRQRRAEHEAALASLDEAIRSGRDAIERAAVDLSGIQERIEERVADLASRTSAFSAIEDELRGARATESETVGRRSAELLRRQRAEMDIAALDALVHQRYEVRLADLAAGAVEDESADAEDLPALESRAEEHRERMASMGEVNLSSLDEHRELADRYAFLSSQKEDLETSLDDLARAIQRINRTTRERFAAAFGEINGKFAELFPRLFQGGRAQLRLLEEENLLESGVEIFVQLPGKKALPLHSLSGGESALTAISLILSIFLVKPSPFCLLDEVDAPLDDANVDRFNAMVREMSSNYQFLLITHNKRTMELADVLYGITMEKPGISRTVSVKLSA